MRAAVIRRSGDTPALEEFADPQPGQGLSVGSLVAAALNPLDVLIVNDQLPFRRLQPPCIAGYEAVVQLGDGTRWYLAGPPVPYGALAELVPVPDSAGFPVPASVDPGLAAALGVAGIVGWVSLDYRAHLQTGETVLVLGAGGSAGQLAVQSARILGAGRVVGAARGKDLEQVADRGADAVVDLADDQAIDAGLAGAAPGGYDVIVDFLWGGPAPQLTLVGQGTIGTPAEIRRSAYAQLMRHATDGKFTLDLEQTRLDDISQTWEHLKAGAPRKLVVIP
jgi:NADPH:quinone reductase-like Zn-dependent oxidoreductase